MAELKKSSTNPDATSTNTQAAKQAERRNGATRRIRRWLRKEAKTLPARSVSAPNPSSPDVIEEKPEGCRLPLPSSFSLDQRQLAYSQADIEAERDLRHADAHETLTKLRRQLRVRTFLNRFKKQNIRGQVSSTRAHTLQGQVDEKIRGLVLRYRHARTCYLALADDSHPADSRLRELRDEDVRGLSDRLLKKHELEEADSSIQFRAHGGPHAERREKLGEGHRTLSWLWYSTSHGDEEEEEMNEGEHKCTISLA